MPNTVCGGMALPTAASVFAVSVSRGELGLLRRLADLTLSILGQDHYLIGANVWILISCVVIVELLKDKSGGVGKSDRR